MLDHEGEGVRLGALLEDEETLPIIEGLRDDDAGDHQRFLARFAGGHERPGVRQVAREDGSVEGHAAGDVARDQEAGAVTDGDAEDGGGA